MNRLLVSTALLLGSLAASCGGGECPDTSNVEPVEVQAGDYVRRGDLDVYPSFWSFESSTEHSLVVDRDAETAVLTYIDADGNDVVVEYAIESTSWVF